MQILAKNKSNDPYFLRQTIVDFVLIVILLNIGLAGFGVMIDRADDLHLGIQILLPVVMAGILVRLGTTSFLKYDLSDNDLPSIDDPETKFDTSSGSIFLDDFKHTLSHGANGFVVLCYPRSVQTIEKELGLEAGQVAMKIIKERIEKITKESDICGPIEPYVFALFLRDRNSLELHQAMRILSGTSIFPNAASDPMYELFSYVGCAETSDSEPAIESIKRANAAMVHAQNGINERYQIWRGKM